jgi:hypothetical protein
MIKRSRHGMLAASLGCGLVLGGCISSTDYEGVSEALRNSPALLADRIDHCTKNYRASSAATNSLRQEMKLPRGTDDVTIAATACRRAFTAIAQGRMSYDEFLTMFSPTPKPIVYRVLQGR